MKIVIQTIEVPSNSGIVPIAKWSASLSGSFLKEDRVGGLGENPREALDSLLNSVVDESINVLIERRKRATRRSKAKKKAGKK